MPKSPVVVSGEIQFGQRDVVLQTLVKRKKIKAISFLKGGDFS